MRTAPIWPVAHCDVAFASLVVSSIGASSAITVGSVRKVAIAYASSVYAGRPLKEKEKGPRSDSGKGK